MARKQQVIHLHNTSTKGNSTSLKAAGMKVGELAMYNASAATEAELYILDSTGENVIPFASKDYIDAIDAKVTGLTDNLDKNYATADEIAQEFVNVKKEIAGADSFVSGDASSATTVAGAKAYADEKISTAINGLDYTGTAIGDSKVVTFVKQEDGIVSATAADLGVTKTSGTNTDTYQLTLDGKNVGEAIVVDKSALESAKSYVDEEIKKLDYTGLTEVHVVTNVTETDGIVSATGANFSVSGETLNNIKTHKLYLGDTVVAQWENDVNTFLDDVKLSGETLVFTWNTGSWKAETTLDISSFFTQAEAGNGLSADSDGVLHVGKATASANDDSKFLFIGEDGIGLSGITKAIEDAKPTDYYTQTESDGRYAEKKYGLTDVTNTTGNDGINLTITTTTEGTTLSAVASEAHKAAHITGATGDSYVEASFANNQVTVKATDTLANGIIAANSAVQKIKVYDASGAAIEVSGTTADLTTMVIDCGTY